MSTPPSFDRINNNCWNYIVEFMGNVGWSETQSDYFSTEYISSAEILIQLRRPYMQRDSWKVAQIEVKGGMPLGWLSYSCHWEWANISLVVLVKVTLRQLITGSIGSSP